MSLQAFAVLLSGLNRALGQGVRWQGSVTMRQHIFQGLALVEDEPEGAACS